MGRFFIVSKMELFVKLDYLTEYTTSFTNALISYAPNLIAAFVLLFAGIWIIKIINQVSRKIMTKREIEPTLIEFLSDIIFWGLRIVLFIAVISKLGIESSSFVAILGAAGLAVGLSLQGSLSNFAGGMLIILFKPFKLGDTIEAQSVSGTVIDIQIFVTQLLTANNQVIFIPNGALSNGTIINYSQKENRRTDLTISISYDTDIKNVKEIILEILNQNPKVLKEPKATVAVKELTDSGIKIAIRAWAKNEDFFDISTAILEDSKTAFDAAKISFQPYMKESVN
jgi:small conductance mechanosensitive channel